MSGAPLGVAAAAEAESRSRAVVEPVLHASAAAEAESRSWVWAAWVALPETVLHHAASAVEAEPRSRLWVALPEPVLHAAAAVEAESRSRAWAVWAALLQAPTLGMALQLFGTKVGMTAALLLRLLQGGAGILHPGTQPVCLPAPSLQDSFVHPPKLLRSLAAVA